MTAVDHDSLLLEELATIEENWTDIAYAGQVLNLQETSWLRTLLPDGTFGFVGSGAKQTRMAHRSRSVIVVVDNDSSVRHEISEVLSASGYNVRVFHSPEALIASNALYAAGMLILGGLRCGLVGCEPLGWAAVEHANLPMLLISKSGIHVCRLGTLYSGDCMGSEPESTPSDRLESLFVFLRLGSDVLPLHLAA
jgi:hypothetical protein